MENTDKMIETRSVDSAERYHSTFMALRQMVEAGEKINFYTVSEKAGVSRTYLYKHSEFKRLIQKYKDLEGITDTEELEVQCTEPLKRVKLLQRRRTLENEWERV